MTMLGWILLFGFLMSCIALVGSVFLSALTFLLGGLVAYAASGKIDVAFLVPPHRRRGKGQGRTRTAAVVHARPG